jgi:polysaccharide biosynthesis/export protein
MGIRVCHAEVLLNRDVPVQSWLPFWFHAGHGAGWARPRHQYCVAHALGFFPKSVISEICKSTFVGSPAGDVCSGPPASLSVHAKHGKDDSSSSSSVLSLRFPKPEGTRFRRQYFECLVAPSRPALSFAVAQKQQTRVDSRQGSYGTVRGCIRWIAVALLLVGCGSAAFAQKQADAGAETNSRSGFTGAVAEAKAITAANPGGADGLGNPLLGGVCHPLYRLHPSDVVELTFTVAPEFNQTLTVQPDGYVMLKDAGLLRAQDLNVQEFSDAVRKAYSGYLHDPQPAVALKEFERPYFIVGGEVGKPGKYDLRSDTTVAEAVQIAGGFTHEAKHSQVVLFRRVNEDLLETRLLNLKRMLKESRLDEDAHVQSGDMVFVPQNKLSKISRFLTRPAVGLYMNGSQF